MVHLQIGIDLSDWMTAIIAAVLAIGAGLSLWKSILGYPE
jgi:hypothetical protein